MAGDGQERGGGPAEVSPRWLNAASGRGWKGAACAQPCDGGDVLVPFAMVARREASGGLLATAASAEVGPRR